MKYLHDLYSHFAFDMLGFLVEVLEKGPSAAQAPVLTIVHCLLHYIDMSQATQTINADLLRTVARFVEVIETWLHHVFKRFTNDMILCRPHTGKRP